MDSLYPAIPVLIVLAGGVLIYFFAKNGADAHAEDASLMPAASRRTLIYYLLLLGSFLVYMIIALNSIDLPEATVLPEAANFGIPSPAAGQKQNPEQPAVAPADTTPVLLQVFPQATTGNTPTISLALYGRNFNNDSKVRLNMRPLKFLRREFHHSITKY